MTRTAAAPAADAAIRIGSRSFAIASRLFDRETRYRVWALYAWCRRCDDVIDGQLMGHGPIGASDNRAALEGLRTATDRALAGATDGPEPFAGLARAAVATGLPTEYPRAHLDGFAMDVEHRTYETLDDTLDYCYHVAGVVGLMMAWLMGVRDAPTLQRGCDLGLAFQLTNIARDVADDAKAGRVYLPAAWLRDAGGTAGAAELMSAANREPLVRAVARVLDEADRYYASAEVGIARLPFRCAWAVGTARLVYADIGHQVRRRGGDAWTRRSVVPTSRKLLRMAQALGETVWARRTVLV